MAGKSEQATRKNDTSLGRFTVTKEEPASPEAADDLAQPSSATGSPHPGQGGKGSDKKDKDKDKDGPTTIEVSVDARTQGKERA